MRKKVTFSGSHCMCLFPIVCRLDEGSINTYLTAPKTSTVYRQVLKNQHQPILKSDEREMIKVSKSNLVAVAGHTKCWFIILLWILNIGIGFISFLHNIGSWTKSCWNKSKTEDFRLKIILSSESFCYTLFSLKCYFLSIVPCIKAESMTRKFEISHLFYQLSFRHSAVY